MRVVSDINSWIIFLHHLTSGNFYYKWQFLPRDAMLAHYIGLYAVVACLSVCVSVKLRYSIKTAKRRITQIMPHDGHGNAKDNGEIPYGGDECK